MQNPSTPPKYKRRNKLPKPRFQLWLACTFMSLVVMSLFVQTLVCGAQFAVLAGSMDGSEIDMMSALPGLLGKSLLYGCLLIVPALGIMVIYITFRMAGPIYRFELHLRAVIAGEEPGVCRIRKGDHHGELCDLINEALDATAQQAVSKDSATSRPSSKQVA
ncbi:MAG: hypothetical protein GY930_17500 [bacterium]|nr:hypothetical protein [bacterium]